MMMKLFAILCIIRLLNHRVEATENPVYISCSRSTDFTANSTYQANLDIVLSSLLSNSTSQNGFYSFSAGHSPSDTVYGSFFCRGDLTTENCKDCVMNATKDMNLNCSGHRQSIIWTC
ncbi:hypothetical protein RCOM_0905960 [Ricinus communis]|uniref:Gnk2-homologous domain-containing protein n=1 Tax=Ricinus communis TaxID=3988 RepID=B9RXS6_RICCO|nr:hypothetical protein RCOM_0905960 [Ricinus communis]